MVGIKVTEILQSGHGAGIFRQKTKNLQSSNVCNAFVFWQTLILCQYLSVLKYGAN